MKRTHSTPVKKRISQRWAENQLNNDQQMTCPYEWGSMLIALGVILIAFGIGVIIGGYL